MNDKGYRSCWEGRKICLDIQHDDILEELYNVALTSPEWRSIVMELQQSETGLGKKENRNNHKETAREQ
jgi:hypothetical protein